jgi:L-iditol 2-dehydrogenase
MRAATLFGARDLRVVETEDAILGPQDVRVAVARVGLCGSDTHFFAHGRVGAFALDGPLVIGHEASGVVVEVGGQVHNVRVGDRVAMEPGRPCGTCPACRDGGYNLCSKIEFPGLPPNPGFLAERAVIPERCAHPIPSDITLEDGALLEPLSVALWANSRAPVPFGGRVLVAGAGPIGLLVARVARAAGAAEVTVADLDSARVAALAGEPLVTAVDVSKGWGGIDDTFDRYFECTGAPEALTEGLRHLRRHGWAVVVGIPPSPEMMIPAAPMRFRELSITYSFRYADTWPTAIDVVARGIVRVDDLVTSRYRLDDVTAAFRACLDHQAGVKAMMLVGSVDEP